MVLTSLVPRPSTQAPSKIRDFFYGACVEGLGTRLGLDGYLARLGFTATCKVKRGNSDIILTAGVIPTLECSSSFIKVKKLKTAMHIAVLLSYTESKKSSPNSTVRWRYKRNCRNYPAVGIAPAPPCLTTRTHPRSPGRVWWAGIRCGGGV